MRKTSVGFCVIGLGIVSTLWGCNNNTNPESQEIPSTSGGEASSLGGESSGASSEGSSRLGAGGTSPAKSPNVGGSSLGGAKVSRAATTQGGTSSTSSRTSPASSGGSTMSSSATGSTSGGMSSTSGATTSAKGGATSTSAPSIGGSGAGGSSSTRAPSRGPTPKDATANFPFPQNRFSSNCIYPKGFKNEDVKAVYTQWKDHLVTSEGAGGFRRVIRPDEPGLQKDSTVSEGIGYGMIISVYMNDQELFDDLWRYALLHASGGVLMDWYIWSDGRTSQGDPDTNDPGGGGAATDADEDMAWALAMADKQWGGKGQLDKSYSEYAQQMIGDIWTYEIADGKLPKNGTGWGGWDNLNVSYFAPSYYRVFAKISGQSGWGGDVVDTVYDVIEGNLTPANGNEENGLVPAFSTSKGEPAAHTYALKHFHQYDSCRTPFRIGLDACQFNEERAKWYLAKISKFYAGKGAAGIVDGYQLDGTEYPEPETQSRGFQGRSAAFIGPAGVGAMHDSSYQTFIDDVWDLLRQNNMWHGGQYYDESWTILSMLALSGNFLDYTAEKPLAP